MTKTKEHKTGLYVGRIVSFTVADGRAFYKVVKIGKKSTTLEWVEDKEQNPDGYRSAILGKKGAIENSTLKSTLAYEDMINKIVSDGNDFYDTLEVNQIVHYDNGFCNFVRCRVVIDSGEKKLLPIALVGNWKDYDLKWNSYYPQKIQKQELFNPHGSCIFEHNPAKYKLNPWAEMLIDIPEKPVKMPGIFEFWFKQDAVIKTRVIVDIKAGKIVEIDKEIYQFFFDNQKDCASISLRTEDEENRVVAF